MKKNIFFALFSAMLLMTACQQHEIDSPADLGDGFTLVGHSDAQTKTAFGTPDGNTIPFLWSEGDKIWSNGAQSDPASVSNDGATALFSFTSGSMAGQVYYNMTGASATGAYVKSEQSIGNLGANGDFGYATVEEGSFTLNHATAYLWFNVTSDVENATLESINIDAYEANISGKATWNGSSFGDLTEASKSVTLTVGETLSSTNENVWAMVIFPSSLTGAKVTYKLTVGSETKYFFQELNAGETLAGQTARISANITSEGLKDYELRVLTFEDKDAKFESYEVNGKTIEKWSDLIDDPQYDGPLTYDYEGTYFWYDEGNTELSHSFSGPYWGGGHAISNYVVADYENLPDGKNGWHELQFQIPILPKSGSNFCVHNGYSDFFNSQIYDATLVGFSFPEGTEGIVDHMYVTNTSYHLNSISYGDGFNTPLADDGYIKIIAYGYDKEDNDTGSTEIYLSNGSSNIAVNWLKFDLTPLGKVNKVVFNFEASEDQSGAYGLNCPAYFAYDDVAVRFPLSK
mgnify:CR=1 FL=1